MRKGGVLLRMRVWGSVGGHYPCCPGHDGTRGKGLTLWRRKLRAKENRAWRREWEREG